MSKFLVQICKVHDFHLQVMFLTVWFTLTWLRLISNIFSIKNSAVYYLKKTRFERFLFIFGNGGELGLRSLQNKDLGKQSFETLKSKYEVFMKFLLFQNLVIVKYSIFFIKKVKFWNLWPKNFLIFKISHKPNNLL